MRCIENSYLKKHGKKLSLSQTDLKHVTLVSWSDARLIQLIVDNLVQSRLSN